MPKILKIIGKSVLCFAGLAMAGWGVEKLEEYILQLEKPHFFGILSLSFTGIILWLLLGIIYAYVLFLMLKDQKRRALIVAINGAANFLLFIILLIFGLYGDIMLFSYRLSNTYGLITIILAIMFNNLASPKKIRPGAIYRNKFFTLLGILENSIVCFLAIIIVLYGYAWLYETLQEIAQGVLQGYIFYLLFSILPVTYACVFYKFIQRNTHKRIIMIVNAAFLLAVWSLIYLYDLTLPFNIDKGLLCVVCGNTALVTIVLAFIFRSVEKRGLQSGAYWNTPQARNDVWTDGVPKN